ncbi:unnamed protein product [Prorocentrum cordatum]|uniref:Uncharacterized protein n=1 Tax=Prorocentrum cordatum TaxID=2364126 RepID=A0ABN9UAQ5_9DINO|nr:unnamed protein product [Polarella glacialis]
MRLMGYAVLAEASGKLAGGGSGVGCAAGALRPAAHRGQPGAARGPRARLRGPAPGEQRAGEWTLAPAGSDCTPGHMGHYIEPVLCSQACLARGDVEGAGLYVKAFGHRRHPVAIPCMDPGIWTLTPEDFYSNYRRVVLAAGAVASSPAASAQLPVVASAADEAGGRAAPSAAELRALAWRAESSGRGPEKGAASSTASARRRRPARSSLEASGRARRV